MLKDNQQIITYNANDSASLKEKAVDVESFNSETKDIIHELKKVFDKEKQKENGIVPVGIAAPQIGIPKRIFVVSLNDVFYVFVNPSIKPFGKKTSLIEGCLSFPDIYIKVDRPEKVKVKYFNEKGDIKKLRAQDFPAKVIQHEHDHLDGILLSDKEDFINAEKEAKANNMNIKDVLNQKYFTDTEE